MRTMRGREWLAVALAVMAFVVIGCENGVGSSSEGRAQGVVKDHPQQANPKVSGAGATSATFTGDLTANTFVSLSADGTTWVDLGSPNGITIKLQNTTDSTNVHGEQDARVGTYARVRLVLQNATATIKAGSTIGSLTLTSDTTVKVGGTDQRVEIDKAVSFQVSSETSFRTAIVFELNAEQWITEQSVQAGVVEDTAIQQATTVAARTESRS
ncbi:MAG: hypothetical protein HY710_04985 [Candidatus Latescibacteria bacterium]|nr:hypothetical protein [Candidatus Latescibacterota bacterium]